MFGLTLSLLFGYAFNIRFFHANFAFSFKFFHLSFKSPKCFLLPFGFIVFECYSLKIIHWLFNSRLSRGFHLHIPLLRKD